MIIDKMDGQPVEEKEIVKPEGAEDGAQDDPIKETSDAEPEPSENSDPNGGAEGPEDGEPGQENAGEPEPEAQPAEPTIAQLQSQLAEMTAKVEAALAIKNNPAPVEPKVAELTDEQWAKAEEQYGMSRNGIQFMTGQIVKAVQSIMGEMDKRFGSLDKDKAFDSLAKDPQFADAKTYQKEMNEWLGQFDPSLHSKPELLKSAYWVAKGKNAGKVVAKVRKEGERNKQVAGAGRPAAPNTGARSKTPAPLNGYQKRVAEMMGGEDAYRKTKALARQALDA